MNIKKFIDALYRMNIRQDEAFEIIGEIAVKTNGFLKKFDGTLGPGKRKVNIKFIPDTGFILPENLKTESVKLNIREED